MENANKDNPVSENSEVIREQTAKEVPKPVAVKRGFDFGDLVFMLVLGMLIGGIGGYFLKPDIDSLIKKGSERVGAVLGQAESESGNPEPMAVTKRVSKAELIATLNTIRAYVAPIKERIEVMETDRDRELLMRSILINQEGKPEDSIDCQRLEKRADKIQRDIDAKESEIKEFIDVETELKLALDNMVTEGYESTTNPQANKALDHGRKLAIRADIDHEIDEQLKKIEEQHKRGSSIPDEDWKNDREGKRTLILVE